MVTRVRANWSVESRRRGRGLIVALGWLGLATAAGAQSFTGLGTLPGGSVSYGFAISADGSVAVGGSDTGSTSYRAFRWTRSGGMESLGLFPGDNYSYGYAVSADGSAIAGVSVIGALGRAFRWTAEMGMISLAPLDLPCRALGISGDGSVVVGRTGSGGPTGLRAFRWTRAAGLVQLEALPGGAEAGAYGVSDDGSTIVGYSYALGSASRAVRWTAAGIRNLGTLPGRITSRAWAVSGDGSVVVGDSDLRAFRWTEGGGMVGLGAPPGCTGSRALGTNRDGTVVVGEGIPYGAFLWTPALGAVDLNAYLPNIGIDLTGWGLQYANGTSADGRAIVGYGWHNGHYEAWVATLPDCYANCDGSAAPPVLNVLDFVCFQQRFAAGAPYADCDHSGSTNAADLVCFQAAFVAGCR